jgi:hypothetical protein
MKIVRVIVYEGSESWLTSMMIKSLKDGQQDFLSGTQTKIAITTVVDERGDEEKEKYPTKVDKEQVP